MALPDTAAPDATQGTNAPGTVTVSPEERAKYMRTMAGDMAALVGGGAQQPSKDPGQVTAPKKADPPPAPEPEVIKGVTLPERERPFFERFRGKSEDKVPEPEILPSREELAEVVEDATPPAPPPPQPSTTSPASSREDEERKVILERLRQKVLASAPPPATAGEERPKPVAVHPPPFEPAVTKPAPAPQPLQPLPQSMRPARVEPSVPVNLPGTEPVVARRETPAPRTPEPEPEPVAPPAPEPPPVIEEPKAVVRPPTEPVVERPAMRMPEFPPIPERPEPEGRAVEPIPLPEKPARTPAGMPMHTYGTDFADRIDASKASAFSVLAAEQDARPPAPATIKRRNPGRALMLASLAIVTLGLVGAGGYGAYRFVASLPGSPALVREVPSIVFADEYRELNGTGAQLLDELSVASGTLLPGNALVAYIADPAATSSPLAPAAGGATFMRALSVPAPDILLRNIAEASTIGVIEAGGESRAFFALRVDSYERTYAGMLDWEPLLRRDLFPLYPLYEADVPIDATPAVTVVDLGTGTSTSSGAATSTTLTEPAPEPVQAVALTRFADAVVANRDVRVLRDSLGRSLVLYGYADKRTLLIARDEAAFEALLARLKD